MLTESLGQFAEFFWSVFSFWLVWQLCDLGLARLKAKLRPEKTASPTLQPK